MKKKLQLLLAGIICLASVNLFGQQSLSNTGNSQVCGNAVGTLTVQGGGTVTNWQEGTLSAPPNSVFTVTAQYPGAPSFNYNITAPGVKLYRALVSGVPTHPLEIRAYGPSVAGTLSTSTTSFYLTGTGQLQLAGSSGTVAWEKLEATGGGWQSTTLPNNTFNITKTTSYQAMVTSGPCASLPSNSVLIKIYNAGVIQVTDAATFSPVIKAYEDQNVALALIGHYGTILRWEYSTNGGLNWINILNTTTTLRHLITATTKFRAVVDAATFGPKYSNEVQIVVEPFSQIFPSPVNGENYVQEQEVRTAGVINSSNVNALSVGQRLQSTTYQDGFGRSIQRNSLQATPTQKDIVTFSEYDNQGRQSTQYLSYPSPLSNGSYRSVAFSDMMSFYTNVTPDKVKNDTHPFAKVAFEKSPLAKILEQGSFGFEWQPGNGNTQRTTYATNDATDAVRAFSSGGGSVAFYADNELTKVELTDQDEKRKQIFTDKIGKTVLTRVQLDETVNGGPMTPWLETYYIYNISGDIESIISPSGVVALKSASWNLTTSIRNQYVTEFIYDARGRLIEKKTPGKGWTYYCYDRLDRLLLVQDANIRSLNKWFYLKYDRKGRPVIQGLYLNNTHITRAAIQQNVVDPLFASDTQKYYEERGTISHGYTNQVFPTADTEILFVNYYDGYDFNSDNVADYAYVPQNLPGEIGMGPSIGLPTGTKRLVLGTTTWLHSYIFYDNYGRPIQVRSNNHMSAAIDNLETMTYNFSGNTVWRKSYHNAGAGKEMVVHKRFIYDHAGRLKQIYQQNNNDAEVLLVHHAYNELGQLVDKKLHCTTCPAPNRAMDEPGGFPATIDKTVYNTAENVLVATNQIRLLPNYTVSAGNTLTAKISRSVIDLEAQYTASSFLQSVDYRYTINGSLESINNAQLTNDGLSNDESNDYFGMEFTYNALDGVGNAALHNGNISAIKWKGPGLVSGVKDQRTYVFTYDKANRLRSATSKMNDGTSWTKEVGVINESMSYDYNGNILGLQRNARKHQLSGLIASYVSETIDDMTYVYNSAVGDQLLKVTDGTSNAAGFNNGTSGTANDYTYDANGSLLVDSNKGISGITYNYLGKATQVLFTDGRKIDYILDAAGTKLTMKTYAAGGSLQLTTDYVNGFIYENNSLTLFGAPEGRVVKKGNVLEYQYAITDHQGNTRVVFASSTPTANSYTTDFESETNENLLNYPTGGGRSGWDLFNRTSPTPPNTRSQLLNGGNNSRVGVAKTFRVYPGDKVKIEAYAKYYNPQSTNSNLTGFAIALTAAFGLSPGLPGEAGLAYQGLHSYGSIVAAGGGVGNNTFPKAFVTILLFDKNHKFLDVAFEQIDGGSQAGVTPKAAHDYMSREYIVKEDGYAYAYISNESPTAVEIYFDDVIMTHTPTNIIQYNDYYPFGWQASTSWTRENNSNNFLYNAGSELNGTSSLYETIFRNYDPTIGRFISVDPMATKYAGMSSYHYSFDNPVMFNDPSGADSFGDPYGDPTRYNASRSGNTIEDQYAQSMAANPIPPSDWDRAYEDYINARNRMFAGSSSNGGFTSMAQVQSVIESMLAADIVLPEISISDLQGDKKPDWWGNTQWFMPAQQCPTCLDPATLHKNLLGLSYPGGNNPRSYNGDDNFTYVPYSKAEYPAIGHDRRYSNLGAAGAKGLLFDTRTIGADLKFVQEEFQIAFNPQNRNEHEKLDALILGIGLGAASSLKTIYTLISEGPIGASTYIATWYGISSIGVTNSPTKP